MFKRTIPPAHTPDRRSYLWLAVAAALLLFAGGRWVIPLAAWLAPVFLLRFVRTQRLLPGLLLAWLVRSAAAAVVTQGTILYPGIIPYALVVFTSLVATLSFLADRLLAPRLHGFSGTLVFPLAVTTLEYLSSFGPLGSYYSSAYSQYGDLPLLQLVSVTGIWGITFLIAWGAAVVNWAWERGFAWPVVRGGGLLYAGVLAVVLLGGGARLALFPPEATTVRVAGLSASQAAVAAFNQQLPHRTLDLLLAGQATPADRALARAAFTTIDDDLFARSQQEARAGAKIVLWPESSPTGAAILQEDAPVLIRRAGALARQEGIYLDLGLAVFLPAGGKPPFLLDEAVLLDPTGNVVWTYEKTHPAPGEEGLFVLGDGKVPLVDSPYGRLANVICFDQDFPGMIRQAGQAGADLLFGPSDDWQAIDPAHTQRATFRAMENGFSLVRQASGGLSTAVDYEGRVLAASDYFTTDQQVLVADVPIHGVRTIYATIGDLFAWLCISGLLALTGLAIIQSRQRPSAAAAAAPLPEPPPAG
ncbi:MAG TPA: nitrilase-related carbon-nitrogen hydrolase [Chloroflexia bacterium]|nr:nitrilase-related carbon-nitrogen hydrolase [Chloroflexia bacterium]